MELKANTTIEVKFTKEEVLKLLVDNIQIELLHDDILIKDVQGLDSIVIKAELPNYTKKPNRGGRKAQKKPKVVEPSTLDEILAEESKETDPNPTKPIDVNE